MYTLKRASEKLDISIVTLRRYIKQGKLTAKKVGKEYRIAEGDVEALLAVGTPTDPHEIIEHTLETNNDFRYEFQRSDAFHKAEKLLREQGKEKEADKIYKDGLIFAFRLIVEARAEKNSKTNMGRFSPRMTGKDSKGNDAAWPDPALITKEVVQHAKQRANEVKNPITKAVYCDVVFEYSKNADRPTYGKKAIKYYLLAAEAEPFDEETHRILNVQSHILRALELTSALKDDDMFEIVVAYAVEKMKRLVYENRMRILIEIIEELLKEAKKLDDDTVKDISELIERAERYYIEEEKNEYIGRSIIELKKMLPKVKASMAKQKEVQRELFDSFMREGAAKSTSGMVASHFYSEALKIGGGVISPEEQAELRRRIEQANLVGESEMQVHSFDITIKNEDIKEYIDRVLVDDLHKSLIRIALLRGMIPSVERAEKTAKEYLEKFPISQMVGRSSLQDGRVVSITPGGHELTENHIIDRLAEEIQVHGLFLGFLFDELKKRGLNAEKLAAYLSQKDFFNNEALPAVSEALALYFEEKYFSAVTVLLPQIEQILRLANRKLGKPTLRSLDSGEQRVIYLQEALANLKEVLDGLSPDAYQYLCLVLWDKRGPGLRDSAAHGLLEHCTANKNQANLLLQIILMLAVFEFKEVDSGSTDATPLKTS